MNKKLKIATGIALLSVAIVALAEPTITRPIANYFKNTYTGVVMTYVTGLGTNTTVEFDYDSNVPCRLSEVNATIDGTETNVTVSRIWMYQRAQYDTTISTNFGIVETNDYFAGYVSEEVTNLLYTSSSDTLPVAGYFQRGDVVQVDTGSATNAIIRLIGTAN